MRMTSGYSRIGSIHCEVIMAAKNRKRQTRKDMLGRDIPREEWGEFLVTFTRRHHGWLLQFETRDLVTGENVVSQETLLHSIEFDLEDEKNPRINVTVQLDDKVIKHILFLPSRVVLESSEKSPEQLLRIKTVNTETIIHFRSP
jgi:hypothetical protein